MGVLKPIRDLSDRIVVGELLDKSKQVCTRSVRPYYCNGNNKFGDKRKNA